MNRWRKLAAIGRSDRFLLAEAAFVLLRARLGLAFLPFARVMASHSDRKPGNRGSRAMQQIGRVGWAVETAAQHVPLRLTCLPQALAATWMLRSRGCSPRLIYGVSTDRDTGFEAHAWVELDGISVVGGRAARGFTVLASFPSI